MSDLRDLYEIHRHIDEAVLADRSLQPLVARYLTDYAAVDDPDYGDPVGWTRATQHLLLGRAFEAGDPIDVDLDGALDRLAGSRPVGRMQSRLLLALAILPRVDPDYAEGGPRHDLYLAALSTLTTEGTTGAATRVYSLLLDDDLFPSIREWRPMLRELTGSGVAVRSLTHQPEPCSGTFSMERVPPDDPASGEIDEDPVPRLYMTVEVDIPDAAAEQFMDPTNWPHCTPFYCDMEKLCAATPAGDCYLETLSLDCDDTTIEKLKVCLVFTATGDAASGYMHLKYVLPEPGHGCCSNCLDQDQGKVIVDHGDLEMRKTKKGWVFTSTKYYLFRDVVDGGATAMFICVIGYGSQVEDFLHTCFAEENGGHGPEHLEPGRDEPIEPEPVDPAPDDDDSAGGADEDEMVLEDLSNPIDLDVPPAP